MFPILDVKYVYHMIHTLQKPSLNQLFNWPMPSDANTPEWSRSQWWDIACYYKNITNYHQLRSIPYFYMWVLKSRYCHWIYMPPSNLRLYISVNLGKIHDPQEVMAQAIIPPDNNRYPQRFSTPRRLAHNDRLSTQGSDSTTTLW